MEIALLWIIVVCLIVDIITNIILAKITPIWGKLQKQELAELRKQNRELKDFIALYTGETDEADNRGNDRAVEE